MLDLAVPLVSEPISIFGLLYGVLVTEFVRLFLNRLIFPVPCKSAFSGPGNFGGSGLFAVLTASILLIRDRPLGSCFCWSEIGAGTLGAGSVASVAGLARFSLI